MGLRTKEPALFQIKGKALCKGVNLSNSSPGFATQLALVYFEVWLILDPTGDLSFKITTPILCLAARNPWLVTRRVLWRVPSVLNLM